MRNQILMMKKDSSNSKTEEGAGAGSNLSCCSNSNINNILDVLPIHVFQQILFKLPVNSISLCRCVCKAWQHIISEPDFSNSYTNYHLQSVSYHTNFTFLYFLPFISPGSTDLYLLQLAVSRDGDCLRSHAMDVKLPRPFEKKPEYSFLGFYDEFLCMIDERADVVYVGNPITGKFTALPPAGPPPLSRKGNYQPHVYLFGTCGNNLLKVLCITYKLEYELVVVFHKAEIFTVGIDDKWRSLPVPSLSDFRHSSKAITFSGMLIWITKIYIRTFDLAEERLGEIPTPIGVPLHCDSLELALHDHNNKQQLSLIMFTRISSLITIWVMKEYGVAASWTKIVTISFTCLRASWSLPVYEFKIVGDLEDGGGTLFAYRRRYDILDYLISYDFKKNKWSEIDIYTNSIDGSRMDAVHKINVNFMGTSSSNIFCRPRNTLHGLYVANRLFS